MAEKCYKCPVNVLMCMLKICIWMADLIRQNKQYIMQSVKQNRHSIIQVRKSIIQVSLYCIESAIVIIPVVLVRPMMEWLQISTCASVPGACRDTSPFCIRSCTEC